ncbi:MAG TPA: L-lysine 6-transaminase [Candidatus Saccharimonadales bacterium]|nr:L-lysine 6-transaminase [Candidatus Saccharimonadales bacterium]
MTRLNPNQAMETLKKWMLVDGFDVIIDYDKSRGCEIVDARSGKTYLDMFSMVASQPLGMNHPALTEPAFLQKMGKIAIQNPSNSDIYSVETAELVSIFSRLGAGPAMKHLFFVAGGSLAVENALKVAFDWKVRKNFEKGYKEEKGTKVIHFTECFHGRSGYTLSMTNTDPAKTKYFPKFGWPRIPKPSIVFPMEGKNLEAVQRKEAEALDAIKKAIRENKDDIAALIIEPIQGEGGDNHFRAEFFRELRTICDESEIFFIVDEVQTGVGMTGKFWCYQHFGFEPDAIAFGKKSQVCGIFVSGRVDEITKNCFVESSRINSTWGGNLVDMARATRYLEVIEKDGLVDNAARTGAYALQKMQALEAEFPDTLTNTRGRGFFLAVELKDPAKRPDILKHCFQNGMLILPSGTRSIRLRPPLISGKAEIDRALAILAAAVKTVATGRSAVGR